MSINQCPCDGLTYHDLIDIGIAIKIQSEIDEQFVKEHKDKKFDEKWKAENNDRYVAYHSKRLREMIPLLKKVKKWTLRCG